ncbi:uncharacterized protein [Chiloscyllium punctatum]|uniref:uncharacterized protein isoform X1 n=1 Tax=Chiloscyllium punctatum TaxID=137246 RepID=UPI003B63417A
MDPECPQFQVSETAAITDQLTKPKTLNTGGQRYPGRSLFGTTLDSKGFYKGLSEEEQKVATVPSDAQPHNQLEQHKYKPESVNIPKSKNCLDLLRTTSPKSRNTNDIKQDVRDDSSEPKRSLKTSLAGRITGRQIDRERSVPCTPSAMTDGTQSPLCVALQQPPSPEVECIIPQNIKHKFRTHVVDELLADDEVKEFLREKEMPAKSSDSEVPSVQPQEQRSDEISWYEKIGYPLRCNIFPGFSGKWQSEVQSTYTKEVHHRFKRSPDHWHGRTTDHLGVWTAELLACERLSRNLQQRIEEQPKLTRNWPKVISVLEVGKPAVLPQPKPPKSLKRVVPKPKRVNPKPEMVVTKPEIAVPMESQREIVTPAGTNVKKDEAFWQFYNQPLPLL